MSNNTTTSSSSGIGFLGALAIAFIVLKLTGVIAWSWLWVLAPLWIPWIIFGIAAIIIGIIIFIGRNI